MTILNEHTRAEAGFSLIELLIAMGITTFVMGIAVTRLAGSLRVRTREDRRADASADTRRALNAMSRDIANAGYGIDGTTPGNGIIPAHSGPSAIRIMSNLDRNQPGALTPNAPSSPNEDIVYQLRVEGVAPTQQRYILRYDVNRTANKSSVLANRIDSLLIYYFSQKVVYDYGVDANGLSTCDITNVRNTVGGTNVSEVSPGAASYVVLSVCVQLPAVGSPESPGYQPPSRMQLTSDVELRNTNTSNY